MSKKHTKSKTITLHLVVDSQINLVKLSILSNHHSAKHSKTK